MANLKLREDLIAIRKVRHGEVEYVLKDPINMEYYRLTELEYDVAMLFDGERNTQQVMMEVNRGVPKEDWIMPDELMSFIQSLKGMDLFEKSMKEKNAMILARLREDRKSKLTAKKGSLIYKRFPLFDPKEWFAWIYPKVRFFFTPWFIVISLLMMAGSGSIIVANWDVVAEGIKNLVTFQQDHAYGYVTLWIVVLFVIALHEHGHGLTCVHFGGEVREMGLLFLFFQPCLYCNVSDAWTFADRGKRLWVTAAGGYFEFWIGSCFTYIWWLTAEGTVINTISYQAMTVCGLSTVLFNFNPLIKLDGYYILCDLLEVNNLKQQSMAYLKANVKHYIFGEPMPEFEFPRNEARAYLIYGICSSIYIASLLTGIFIMAASLAVPMLKELGFILALLLGYKLFFRYIKGAVTYVARA